MRDKLIQYLDKMTKYAYVRKNLAIKHFDKIKELYKKADSPIYFFKHPMKSAVKQHKYVLKATELRDSVVFYRDYCDAFTVIRNWVENNDC